MPETGAYLRDHRPYEPRHGCALPHKSAPRDVWMCNVCRRVYIWSGARGYGFEWLRVRFRYWWFRAVRRSAQGDEG